MSETLIYHLVLNLKCTEILEVQLCNMQVNLFFLNFCCNLNIDLIFTNQDSYI